MVRFGLQQNTQLETALKTLVYRLYATMCTVCISHFAFGINSFILLFSFALADIVGGLVTYFSFEHIWIYINQFEAQPVTKDGNQKKLS